MYFLKSHIYGTFHPLKNVACTDYTVTCDMRYGGAIHKSQEHNNCQVRVEENPKSIIGAVQILRNHVRGGGRG